MCMRSARWRHVLLAALAIGVGAPTMSACYGRHMFIAIGTAIDVLPNGFLTVMVGTVPYYYHRGIFYRPYRRGYLVVPAPIGAVVVRLPSGHVVIRVEDRPYHYYRGVFYAPVAGRYTVVRPPIGAFVRDLPGEAVTRRVDGVEYKEYAGTYYRPAIREGHRGYQVTDPPGSR